jgi:hypothetical protein
LESFSLFWIEENFGGKKEWALTSLKNFSIFPSKLFQSKGALRELIIKHN